MKIIRMNIRRFIIRGGFFLGGKANFDLDSDLVLVDSYDKGKRGGWDEDFVI